MIRKISFDTDGQCVCVYISIDIKIQRRKLKQKTCPRVSLYGKMEKVWQIQSRFHNPVKNLRWIFFFVKQF